MQDLSHIDPNGPDMACTPSTPSSHCYAAPLKKDGTPAYADFLLATNMVVLLSSIEDQLAFKHAISKACSEQSTSKVVWEQTLFDGVYLFMDDYQRVSYISAFSDGCM